MNIHYQGWPNCYRLANSHCEAILTTDVGPRIIHFGLVGGPNELAQVPDQLGKVGGDAWRLYGGHRLWHAPEHPQRTYHPDNVPVMLEEHDDFVRLIQPIEPGTGIQKELDVSLAPDAAHLQIRHRLYNTGLWPIELAPWAITVMRAGGTAIIPLPPGGAHQDNLLPNRALAIWAYTNMADPRFTWGEKYILVRQDSAPRPQQKIGARVTSGWAAYANAGNLFVKTFNFHPDGHYPDMGSTVEIFTNDFMLEVETLGPLTRLEPGASVEHTEEWFLFGGVPVPQHEQDVEQHILPIIRPLS